MTDLERQCEEIRKVKLVTIVDVDMEQIPSRHGNIRGRLNCDYSGVAKPDLQRRADIAWLLDDVAALYNKQLELRRPSDAKEILDCEDWLSGTAESTSAGVQLARRHMRTALHALAESQRDNARLIEESQSLDRYATEAREERIEARAQRDELACEIARLQSPPEERRDIVERQACRKEVLANGDEFGAVVATRDIDALLQDCARHRNAHVVNMARAEAAEQRVRELRDSELLLTFAAFRRANAARCLRWHPAGIQSWSASDWLTAVTGELGELASLIKMRNRERDGLPGNKFSPTQKQIADEIADVLTYLDLLAESLGVDLGSAAVEKFNEVSERVGFPDRIEIAALASPLPAEGREDNPLQQAAEREARIDRAFVAMRKFDCFFLWDNLRLRKLIGEWVDAALAQPQAEQP